MSALQMMVRQHAKKGSVIKKLDQAPWLLNILIVASTNTYMIYMARTTPSIDVNLVEGMRKPLSIIISMLPAACGMNSEI